MTARSSRSRSITNTRTGSGRSSPSSIDAAPVRAPRRGGAQLRSVRRRRPVLARRSTARARPRICAGTARRRSTRSTGFATSSASACRWSTACSRTTRSRSRRRRSSTCCAELGLPYPRARVINHPSTARRAARGAALSGAGEGEHRRQRRRASRATRTRRRSPRAAARRRRRARHRQRRARAGAGAACATATSRASRCSAASFSTPSTSIPPSDSFDLCPADACQTTDGVELVRGACAVDAPKNGLRVEGVRSRRARSSRRSSDLAPRRTRHRRHRVPRRRPRRQALLLRHQRAVELRRRCAERDRLRSVRRDSSTTSRDERSGVRKLSASGSRGVAVERASP